MRSNTELRQALLNGFLTRFRFADKRFQPSAKPDGQEPGGATALPDAAWRVVARQVMTLHEAYTGGGGTFGKESNPLHRHQAGYQFYYLPRNLFRVRHVLDSLPWQEGAGIGQLAGGRKGATDAGTLRVLDLGCGTGAFSLALLSSIVDGGGNGAAPAAMHIVLVDQGRALLDLAVANIRAFAALALPRLQLKLEPRPEGVEAYLASEPRRAQFGVVGAAMMLNEMALLASRRSSRRAVRFVTPLMRLPREGGLLMFVEPGTRKGYMNLMVLREQLGGWPILYPCPHGKPCPLWSSRVRRWCHATRPLPPAFVFDAELRQLGGLEFGMREINLAAFAVQQGHAGRPRAPFRKVQGARVVSGRLPGRTQKSKAKSPRGAEPAGALPDLVVLQCVAQGRLRESPAEALGPYPRGMWLAERGGRGRKGR